MSLKYVIPNKIEISSRAILMIFGIGLGVWLLVQIRDILQLLFIAFIFMSAMRPSVDFLVERGVPKVLAVILNYIVVICFLVLFGTVVFPPLVSESIKLGTHLPEYIRSISPYVNLDFETVFSQVAPLSQNLARFTWSIFSNVLAIFTLLVFTFYFLLGRSHFRQLVVMFVGFETGNKMISIVRKIEVRLGAWVRGELLLGCIIGVASFVGLTLLGVNYALPLALIAGILEMVPIIGPTISAIPAVLVAFTISPGLALVVVALYIIIQQVENNFIVPTVMHKSVGLPPIAILLALMVGGRLGGTIGIILSVPALLVIQTVVEEVVINSKTPSEDKK